MEGRKTDESELLIEVYSYSMRVFHIVFIFLCLHTTRTDCRPVEEQAKEVALKRTIENIQEEIRKTLANLKVVGLLPNISCASLDMMKQLNNISSIRCYIQTLSKHVREMKNSLDICSQYLQDAEQLRFGEVMTVTCSLPSFDEDYQNYLHTKCLLQLLDERLSAKNSTGFL